MAINFDFTRLTTYEFQTTTYEVYDDFENIFINVETATVTFAPSEDDVCKIVCFEEEIRKHAVEMKNGTLIIEAVNTGKWYDYIGISFQTPIVTVYLPKDIYTSLAVSTKTGNVEVPDRYHFDTVTIMGTTSNISCYASVSKSIEMQTTTGNIAIGAIETETVKLFATTGDIVAKDIACYHMTAKSSTGYIYLENVVAKESIEAENTTGGIQFYGCDAADIKVKTSTGNVWGTLLSEKIFVAETGTGRVNVPKTTSGGICEIATGTGNIDIEIGID